MSDRPITREATYAASAAWWMLLLVGALSLAAGLIVLAKPSHSLTTLAVVFGVFVLLDSIYELVTSLFAERGAVGALLGVLGIVIGILLIRHPVHGVLAVGLLVGIWFVAAGVIRQISYLGSESVYEVELEGGRRVRVLRSNLTRRDQEDFTWDEPVWLAWHACSPAILLS